jgi:hypothetical protein
MCPALELIFALGGLLQGERERRSSDLMEVLSSLWDALGVSPDAMERAALAGVSSGPLRLHSRSLQRVRCSCLGPTPTSVTGLSSVLSAT